MRFAAAFEARQVPEWTSFYIDYVGLKTELHLVRRQFGKHDSRHLYNVFESNTADCFAFRHRKQVDLEREEAEVGQWSGITLDLTRDSELQPRPLAELQDILHALTSLQGSWKQLASFDSINQAAVQRFLSKVANVLPSTSQPFRTHGESWATSYGRLASHCPQMLEKIAHLRAIASEHASRSTATAIVWPQLLRPCISLWPLTEDHLKALWSAIQEDRPSQIMTYLVDSGKREPKVSPVILKPLLHTSVACRSVDCAAFLMSKMLESYDVSIAQEIYRRLLKMLHRSGMAGQPLSKVTGVSEPQQSWVISLVHHLFGLLGPRLMDFIYAKDDYGEYPLHVASRCGQLQFVLEALSEFHTQVSEIPNAVLLTNEDNVTVLGYAAISGAFGDAKMIVDILARRPQVCPNNNLVQKTIEDALALALRYQHDEVVILLTKSHLWSTTDENTIGSLLRIVARTGRADHARTLLDAGAKGMDVDALDDSNGWTPLFIASAHGHLGVVDELIKAGARVDHLDHEGWSAREHAAIRGHLQVAERIPSVKDLDEAGGPASSAPEPSPRPGVDISRANQIILVLTLGSTQRRSHDLPIHFHQHHDHDNTDQCASAEFTVGINCECSSETEQILPSPLLADTINEPFVFHIEDTPHPKIYFKVYKNYNSGLRSGDLVGGGVALLEADSYYFGDHRESLIRERKVPLIDNKTMESMGVATISTLVIHPYPGSIPVQRQPEMQAPAGIELVGHRGLGQNTADKTYLQLGENTIESFLSAHQLGAKMVEFDVQVTRDLVPVLYHDFSLSESGTDVAIHDLTLDQFMYASTIQSPAGHPPSILGSPTRRKPPRPRSRSFTHSHEHGTTQIHSRLQHTVDFRTKGFKPNTRGTSIHSPFTTLSSLLQHLPRSIALNAEIKYPRLHESLDAGLAPVALSINAFVDASLRPIFQAHHQGRRIVLSSFTPEVCVALALKQRVYPVMFITNAGKLPVADLEKRAESVRAAVGFAQRWGLDGVVFACEVFLLCPRLVQWVKGKGLRVASYGPGNSVVENVRVQARAGIDMIMADRVGVVARTLESL